MIDLILEASNTSFSCQNLNKKNDLSLVNVIVSFLWKARSLIGSGSSKIQFFAISSLLTTNSYLKLKLSIKRDLMTIRMYHLRYTQEFQNRFLDEIPVFLKESSIVRNNEERYLAYSYSKKPCIVFDVFAWRL